MRPTTDVTAPSTRKRLARAVDGDPAETMRAVVQSGYGPPEQVLELATVERPAIGDDDVLVRVRATSVNTPDWLTVTGLPYALRPKAGLLRPSTTVRGTDVAGVVAAVGRDVADLRPGDEVFGSAWGNSLHTRAGTFAEYSVASASQLIRKPAALAFTDAAAAVMSGLTALIAMRDVAKVGPRTSVLVNGASGGVGTFAVQIAAALGADVTGVCSTRNVELVRSLGAERVIDYTVEDFTRGGRRYDVVLDNVLNHPPSAVARVLTSGGLLIPNSVGTVTAHGAGRPRRRGRSGRWLAGLPRIARAALLGLGATRVKTVTCVVNRDNLADLAALLTSGDVRVVIDEVYPLGDAARAVAHMLGHHARGKIAIAVDA